MANYAEIEKEAQRYLDICVDHDRIDPALYDKFGVKRGLRDKDGKGVLTGVTNISRIDAFKMVDGKKTPCEGMLWYRGYNVYDLIRGLHGKRFGFEEAAYLLLMGELPNAGQLAEFSNVLSKCRDLPSNFTRDVIMKAPTKDLMNSLTRSVLTLASYDDTIGDNSLQTQLEQCIKLISVFPMLRCTATTPTLLCQRRQHVHSPSPAGALHRRKPAADAPPRPQLHPAGSPRAGHRAAAAHGARRGNNSTFTTRVVTSSGSDTYSVMAAALCSLKGPKHGGANIKVVEMVNPSAARSGMRPTRRGQGLPEQDSGPPGLRPQGPDLRHGPRGLLAVRPPCGGVQELCSAAGTGQGPQEGFRFLQHDRAPGSPGHRRETPYL